MGRSDIRRRYLTLGLGELAAVVVFIGAYVVLLPRLGDDTRTSAVMLGLLAYLLLQGAAYWLPARGWIPGGRMPAPFVALFGGLRWLNVVLLGAVLLVIMPGSAVLLSIGLWLFALVEYVNYFWIRLSYPLSEWVDGVRARRPSRLARDLDRGLRAATSPHSP